MTRQGERKLKMTEERRQEFLHFLREAGGVFSEACRLVSPKEVTPGAAPPCYTTWKTLVEKDETFASAVAEVLQLVRDDIHTEIRRRAMGVQEPVIQRGEQAKLATGEPAFITRYDNKLLLRLASKLDPTWNESKNVEHSVAPGAGAVTHFATADLKYLSDGQKSNLLGILRTIKDAQDGQLALTHQLGEQIAIEDAEDAEYAEVDEAEMAFPL